MDGYTPEDDAEVKAVEREFQRLKRERPRLRGDLLLNAAIEAAGYDVDNSGVECCSRCETIYHRDYGGEYVDPLDGSLLDELQETQGFSRIRSLARLSYAHYCDFDCFLSDVRSGVRRYRN